MNKITQKPELNIQYITLNKAETDSFRHEMIMKTSQLLTKQTSCANIDIDVSPEGDTQQKSIFIKKQALERTISVYQWRHKTCYPVIKPTKLVIKSFTGNIQQKRTLCKKNSQSPFEIWNLDENLYELLVTTEKVHQRLSEIGSLPLPQLFYLLKQVLVGFQCLIDIFGIFQPSEDMIAVNQSNEWKFWISEDFASNSKKEANTTQAQFILKIIKMVQSRLPNSKVGTKFFEELKNLPVRSFTFLNLLDMTNIFISFNKIMVAKKYVSPNGKNNKSLYGSKNQSYFKLNRTYNELKDTPKSFNDRTITNNHYIAHFQHTYSPKNNANKISKIHTMKNLNDKSSYTRKQSINLNINSRQNEMKKQKQLKAHMKISEFYCAQTLTKNNIEKRASFMFNSGQLIKDKSRQDFTKNKVPSGETPNHSQSPILLKPGSYNHIRTEAYCQNYLKMRPTSPRQRKFSFQNAMKTQPNLSKVENQVNQNLATEIHRSPKERKNSYYNYEKPLNKQAFSQSPDKSSKKNIFFQEEENSNKPKQKIRQKMNTKRENILMNDQTINRSRKYSQQVPRIKSLDEFAKKSKKMFESSTMEVAVEVNKNVKYGNLKSKDIACHTRHATISGMAFGQSAKRPDFGFNNINNDMYNGKFQEIMKSIKSRSNGDKNEDKDELNDMSSCSRKRRMTLFDRVREVQQRKISQQIEPELNRQHYYSPFSGNDEPSPKPIIRVSNANNQTAQTLNKSELNLAKGSQQSNSLSNNNNLSNIRQSDINSNEKLCPPSQNRRGMIGESNLSVFSCKTYQPVKQLDKKPYMGERQKHMANSQDCFNNLNQNESESSEEFLKSNNWNKKISGLFSEVASIKMLKESSHFGDEFELFEKDHLKDVKLEKLDKLGKQLKGSIIQTEDGRQILNIPTRGGAHNKSFSLIGEVKEEPYENDPSYLEYSTSMICQSRNTEFNRLETPQVQRNIKHCESFQQQAHQHEQPNGGFNFSTQLYKLTTNQ